MLAFFIAFAFGAVQVFLLKLTFKYLLGGNKLFAGLFILLKFVLYCGGISVLMLKFYSCLTNCACGFVAGMPIFALVLFVVTEIIRKKKSN